MVVDAVPATVDVMLPESGIDVFVHVQGDYACFTRPDFSTERVSHPVITPTAAVGVLENIYWKPEMYYRINWIDVLRPIQWMRMMRNEINSRQSMQHWLRNAPDGGYDATADRAQRHILLLRDVEYVISVTCFSKEHDKAGPAKHRAILMRRLERGQYFCSPYLGCREYLADVSLAPAQYTRQCLNKDLGEVITRIHRDNRGALVGTDSAHLYVRDGRVSFAQEDV